MDMDRKNELWIEVFVMAVNLENVPKATANQTYLPARADFVDKNGDVARVEAIVGSSAASTTRDVRRQLLEAFPVGEFLRIMNLPTSTTKPYTNVAATFPYTTAIKTTVIQRSGSDDPPFSTALRPHYCVGPITIIESARAASGTSTTTGNAAPRHSMLAVVLQKMSAAMGNVPATYKIITSDLKCETVRVTNCLLL
jgi:hypothetical protein